MFINFANFLGGHYAIGAVCLSAGLLQKSNLTDFIETLRCDWAYESEESINFYC